MTKYTITIPIPQPKRRAFITSEKLATGFILIWIWAIGIFRFAY